MRKARDTIPIGRKMHKSVSTKCFSCSSHTACCSTNQRHITIPHANAQFSMDIFWYRPGPAGHFSPVIHPCCLPFSHSMIDAIVSTRFFCAVAWSIVARASSFPDCSYFVVHPLPFSSEVTPKHQSLNVPTQTLPLSLSRF